MEREERWCGSTMIRTHNGLEIDMLDPRPEQIVLGDIAHALALTCRYGGHAPKFYSVAEHSIGVSGLLGQTHGPDVQMMRIGLLHDAAEAYLGDIISPMKRALDALGGSMGVNELEARWLRAIGTRFDLNLDPLPELVRHADHVMFEREVASFASGTHVELPWYDAEVQFVVAANVIGIR